MSIFCKSSIYASCQTCCWYHLQSPTRCKYGYSLDKQVKAMLTVPEQAEQIAKDWAEYGNTLFSMVFRCSRVFQY